MTGGTLVVVVALASAESCIRLCVVWPSVSETEGRFSFIDHLGLSGYVEFVVGRMMAFHNFITANIKCTLDLR